MDTPNFAPAQFVDASSLNTAMNGLVGSIESVAQAQAVAGLSRADTTLYASTGLVLGVTLPSPFGILFANGVFAQAHGTVTNQDTQSYSVSFSGVVPISGSVTAYLLASGVQVQQNPVQIVGPPLGHPDYDPEFVPTVSYVSNVDSLSLYASTTPPDNATSFELGRFTLSAGATGLATINTLFQARLSNGISQNTLYVSGAGSLTSFHAGRTIGITGPGALTLPPVSGLIGSTMAFMFGVSGITLQGSGADKFLGSAVNPSTPSGQIANPPAGTMVSIVGAQVGGSGYWQVFAGEAFAVTQQGFLKAANNLSDLANIRQALLNLGIGMLVRAGGSFLLSTGVTSGGFNLGAGSIVRASTGVYNVTFTNPLANATFQAMIQVVRAGGGNVTTDVPVASRTVNGFQVIFNNVNTGAPIDPDGFDVMVFSLT